MHELYQFLTGPLLWVSLVVFFAGTVYRICDLLIQVYRKESYILTFMSFKYGMRSLLMWMIPFKPVSMRINPVMTVVTFLFHFCLVLTPIFLLGHMVLLDEAWNVSWLILSDNIADVFTITVIFCCGYFLWRRLMKPEVKYVTSPQDYFLLAAVSAPFITGFLAYHQFFSYPLMMCLHVATGEIMLMLIPFTRLVHMVLGPISRAYTGSEFGGVRHARDW